VASHADDVPIGVKLALAAGILLRPVKLLGLSLALLFLEPRKVILGVEVAVDDGSMVERR
jgi:hypothetical protein